MRTAEPCGPDLVIGVGNPLMGDDGLGITAVAQLAAEWPNDESLDFVDGGTWGMNLLPLIEGANRVMILDAIDRGLPPGTSIALEREEIPCYFAIKLSPHQLDLREVLALAELRGTLPDETIALGVQPERVELSLALSSPVAAAVDDLIAAANDRLAVWGHHCHPPTAKPPGGSAFPPPSEQQILQGASRPKDDKGCRGRECTS
jgi:hydrogenase maturation protease